MTGEIDDNFTSDITVPTTVLNAGKVSNALSIQLNGGTAQTYNGSTPVSLNITPEAIGAAPASHGTHLTLGVTSTTAYRGDYGAAAYAHAVTNKGTALTSGLYKITVNSEGHVTAGTAVSKSDITNLGIPAQDTTYSAATTSAAGLMSAADKIKLNGIAENANNYTYTLPTASSSTLGGVKIGTGIAISSGVISNSGVRSITTGSTAGTISVNTGGTATEVAVYGLGSNAYSSTAYLPLAGGTVTGATTFSNTTASSSTSTGAVKISGGLGVAGNIYAAKVYGAVWNDYAEYRAQNELIEPGYITYCDDDGKLKKTTERLQKFEGVVSDTFGFSIGETSECKTPLAISGRVLVYANPEEHFHSGDCVCAGPDGIAYYMTREEIIEFPDRIVGIVSEVPTYDTWGSGNVAVNNRIWIKVR